MSLPPHPRAHSSPPRHRVREALWALAAVILLLLIGGTIAPDSWHHAVSQKASRMWHRVRVLAKESREDLAAPTANHIQSHPEEKLPITPQPRSTIAKPAKSAPPSSDEKSWLPTFDGLVPPQQTTDLKISGLKATVVRISRVPADRVGHRSLLSRSHGSKSPSPFPRAATFSESRFSMRSTTLLQCSPMPSGTTRCRVVSHSSLRLT
jgi:hypothetical protein